MRELAGSDCPRFVVDVGANDGFYASNSYPFAARGWRSLLIEPHPEAFRKLILRHAKRPHVVCRQLACGERPGRMPLWTGATGDTTHATLAPESRDTPSNPWATDACEVDVVRLDGVLAEFGFPERFGILSIDTEGWDVEVLRGMDLSRWRPRVIVTEDGERGTEEKGALLHGNGYECRKRIGVNSFWTPVSP